jgi:FkbH-like protein
MEGLKYSEIIKKNNQLAEIVGDVDPYRISILSNITCNQLQYVLSYYLRKAKLNPTIKIGDYDNIIQDSYKSANEQLVIINYDLANILNKYNNFFEDFDQEQINSLFKSITNDIDLVISNLSQVPSIVFNTFSSSSIYVNSVTPSKVTIFENKLNEYLYSKNETNLNILDINLVVAKIGYTDAFDFRMFYLSKTLYTIPFWKEYVYCLSSIVFKNTGKLKKAIIFDCDNTLWKGVLGEDGMQGIDMDPQSKIGQIYNKVQQIIVWLSKQGVIIGICSKNNLSDIDEVLLKHSDITLKKNHIVISKVNWQDKATNLRNIAKELNIGLDSLIFVDDSSFEINLIKEQLPEILTLQVPTSIHEYPNMLLKLVQSNFYLSGDKNDIDKTQQYKTQFQREEEKTNHQSLEDYLSNIGIEIEIRKNESLQIPRISQLTQKTNQFNLTTKRYTENQIEDYINKNNDTVFSVFVKDNFGESGLTAVIIVNENGKVANIDSFMMSCRIMGRNIEKAIMNHLIKRYQDKGFTEFTAAYFPTLKNKPVLSFYEDSGFEIIRENDNNKYYKTNISEYLFKEVSYIKINN